MRLHLRIAFTFGFRIATSDDAMHSGCFIAFWVFQTHCILGVSDAAEDLGLLPTRGPEGAVPLRPGRPQVERDDLAREDGHAWRTETPEGVHETHVRCQHAHSGQN